MSSVSCPARLFVLLARDAPVGLILRRGPSKWVQLILWHTDTDLFEYGQWFHGRVYEYACDLSPNGQAFIYHAVKYQWENHEHPEVLHRWTAISRPPYFTALALWPNLPYEWMGGFFLSNHVIQLGTTEKPSIGRLRGNLSLVEDDSKEPTIFFRRLLRDGWQEIQQLIWQYPPGRAVQPQIWQKTNLASKYSLVLSYEDFSYSYSLKAPDGNAERRFQHATWMDWDHTGRLVYTQKGQLLTRDPNKSEAQVLGDFPAQEFSDVKPPAWARHW